MENQNNQNVSHEPNKPEKPNCINQNENQPINSESSSQIQIKLMDSNSNELDRKETIQNVISQTSEESVSAKGTLVNNLLGANSMQKGQKHKWKNAVNQIKQIQDNKDNLALDDPMKVLLTSSDICQSRREREKDLLLRQTIGLFDFGVNVQENLEDMSLEDPDTLRLVLLILKKHKYKRTDKEKQILKQTLKNLNFFQKFKPLIHESNYDDIFRHLRYLKVSKFKYVFNYGEFSKQCYVVIHGRALVAVPNRSQGLSEDEKIYLKDKFQMDDEEMEDFELYYPKMKIVNVIEQGQLFGEIGLYFRQPRTATVFSITEELHLATLDSLAFYNTIRYVIGIEQEKRVNFLKNIPLFQSLKENYLSVILLMHEDVTYSNGNIIYTEGEPSLYVYIVYEGEIELSKIVYEEEQEKGENDDYDDCNQILENEQLLMRQNMSIQNALLRQKSEDYLWLKKQNRNLYIKEKEKHKKRIAYSRLGPSSIFGDENMEKQKVQRDSQAKCISSHALLFRIKRQSYWDQLRAYCHQINLFHTLTERDQYNQSRIEDYHNVNKQMQQQIKETIKTIHQKNFIVDYEHIPREFNPHKTSEKVFNINKINENLQLQQSKDANTVSRTQLLSRQHAKSQNFWRNKVIRSTSNPHIELQLLQKNSPINSSNNNNNLQQSSQPLIQHDTVVDSQNNSQINRCTSLIQFVSSLPSTPNSSQLMNNGKFTPFYSPSSAVNIKNPEIRYQKSQTQHSQFRRKIINNQYDSQNSNTPQQSMRPNSIHLSQSNYKQSFDQDILQGESQILQQPSQQQPLQILKQQNSLTQRSVKTKPNQNNCKLFEDSIIKILYPNKFMNPPVAQRKQIKIKKTRIFSLKAHESAPSQDQKQSIIINSEENHQEQLKQQMFVTYKQLKIDKNFPKTATAKQTIQYHSTLYNNIQIAINSKIKIAKQRHREFRDPVKIQIEQAQKKMDMQQQQQQQQIETESDWDDIFNFTGIKQKPLELKQANFPN